METTLDTMESIGDLVAGAALVERLGDGPCSSDGCDGTGGRFRLGKLVMPVFCEACIEKAERQVEDQDHRDRVEVLLRQAGGTERMRSLAMDSYFTDEAGLAAMTVAKGWRDVVIANPRKAPNMFLYGPIGSGKTGLMWPIVESLCEQMVRARLVDFPTLLEQMRQAMHKNVEFSEVSDLGRVPVLVLDDIGAERPTDWTLGQLHQLVNTRYERCLPTAYISNYDPDTLVREKLVVKDPLVAQRIVSRMVEGAVKHQLQAPDRRIHR